MTSSMSPDERARQDAAPDAQSPDPLPGEAWLARGVEDVYFQREAQITWWTILGGIAVAALLTQLPEVLAQVELGKWSALVYFVTTALVIALSWVQTAWGTLVLRWQISIPGALIGFFVGMSQCVLSLQVTKPSAWMVAASLVALSSVVSQVFLWKSGAWIAFKPEYIGRLKIVAWTHGAFGLIALIAALLLHRYPVPAHETLLGMAAFGMIMVALWLQGKGMRLERAMLQIP